MTGTLPNRSVSRPEIGDSANMPNVWPLMTIPTAARPWPCAVMWSGVIVMIRVITTWTVTSETIATGTFGCARTARSETAVERSSAPRSVWSASRYGSGRSSANDRSAALPDEDDRQQVGAGQRRQADRLAELAGPADEFGPMIGAERRAPDDDADGRRPARGREQVRGRVARQLVRGVAEADQDRAERAAAGTSGSRPPCRR